MTQNNIRLIVSDLDGTLLNSKEKLNPDFFPILDEILRREIVFVVATGRQYHNVLEHFDPVKENIYFVTENGGLMIYRDEHLLVVDIPKTSIFELIQTAKNRDNAFTVLCGEKSAYIESSQSELFSLAKRYYNKLEIVDDFHTIQNDRFLKLSFYDPSDVRQTLYPTFTHFEDEFRVVVSGANWLDISSKKATKGAAIEIIQQKLGISPAQTMVFGDFMNDYEMMLKGEHSYAMKNAIDEIKQVSRHIAPSNDDNGVLQVLNNFLFNIPVTL